MAALLQGHAPDATDRIVFHHAVRRRLSLAGVPELFRTHRIVGATAMAVPNISGAVFPSRTSPITFKTAIEITPNAGVHRGLILDMGSGTAGVGFWVEDNKVGFHAGEDGLVNGASAIFDNGAVLPDTLILDLVAAVRPGDGRVRIWANGKEIARGVASSGTFGALGEWGDSADGSFADVEQGAVVIDVPVASRVAPNGFAVIEPLSVYVGQVPRHFV